MADGGELVERTEVLGSEGRPSGVGGAGSGTGTNTFHEFFHRPWVMALTTTVITTTTFTMSTMITSTTTTIEP